MPFPEKSGDNDILTRAIDNFAVGKRHRAVSRVGQLSMLIFDRQFLTQHIAVLKRGEVCPMPYALCPMPYARRVPHVTEKGYSC